MAFLPQHQIDVMFHVLSGSTLKTGYEMREKRKHRIEVNERVSPS